MYLHSSDSVKRGKGCFLTSDGLADCCAFQSVSCFREGDKEEGRRQTHTQVLELIAQHLSADKQGAFPVQKSLASHSQNLCTPVWYVVRRRGHRGDFRPSSKIPVHATQTPMKGNGSLWPVVQEGCCKALASLSATQCSEVSQR